MDEEEIERLVDAYDEAWQRSPLSTGPMTDAMRGLVRARIAVVEAMPVLRWSGAPVRYRRPDVA